MTSKQQEPGQSLDLTQLLQVPKQENDQSQVDKIVKASKTTHNVHDVLTLLLVRIWKPLIMIVTMGFHRYAKVRYQPKTNINNEEKTDG